MPFTNPDIGRLYNFTGMGVVGTMGNVQVAASIKTTGFISAGNATGQIVLSSNQGSVTLAMYGPVQPGFSVLPQTFTYSVVSATGNFEGLMSRGSVSLQHAGSIAVNGTGTVTMTVMPTCN